METETLHMEVINLAVCPGDMVFRCRFEARGGTIGSSPGDSWRLPGPGVVPRHAEIRRVEGRFCLIDRSGRTHINGSDSPMGEAKKALLREGDELAIGPYRIRVGRRSELEPSDERWSADQWLNGREAEPVKWHGGESREREDACLLLDELLREPSLDPLASAAQRPAENSMTGGTAPSGDRRSAMSMPFIRKQEKSE